MYKVFFNDRIVFLGEGFSEAPGMPFDRFYHYRTREELKTTIEQFSSADQPGNLYISHHNSNELKEAFRACFKLIEAGGGLVFNREGHFLIIRRNGIWDLPKGKLERGEDFETAALREVEEETGLKDLDAVQLIVSTYHTYQLAGKRILKETRWYEMFYSGNRQPVLEANEGITESRWIKPGDTEFNKAGTYGSILDVLSIRNVL